LCCPNSSGERVFASSFTKSASFKAFFLASGASLASVSAGKSSLLSFSSAGSVSLSLSRCARDSLRDQFVQSDSFFESSAMPRAWAS
jgi:hypothetical protein